MTKVALFTGGIIHDWQGVGDVLEEILCAVPTFDVTRINDDLSFFADGRLDAYDVMVFYYTRGELADDQKNGLFRWVESGKGFIGVHGATVSFKDSPNFSEFVGGRFIRHPAPREYTVSIVDDAHPITQGMDEFTVFDEQYLMDYDPRVHVLATAAYEGVAVPAAWTKSWGEGRVYYLALAHDPEAARNESFAPLLTRGVEWAATK